MELVDAWIGFNLPLHAFSNVKSKIFLRNKFSGPIPCPEILLTDYADREFELKKSNLRLLQRAGKKMAATVKTKLTKLQSKTSGFMEAKKLPTDKWKRD